MLLLGQHHRSLKALQNSPQHHAPGALRLAVTHVCSQGQLRQRRRKRTCACGAPQPAPAQRSTVAFVRSPKCTCRAFLGAAWSTCRCMLRCCGQGCRHFLRHCSVAACETRLWDVPCCLLYLGLLPSGRLHDNISCLLLRIASGPGAGQQPKHVEISQGRLQRWPHVLQDFCNATKLP